MTIQAFRRLSTALAVVDGVPRDGTESTRPLLRDTTSSLLSTLLQLTVIVVRIATLFAILTSNSWHAELHVYHVPAQPHLKLVSRAQLL